jgi:GT2 family glycosyltransferase
VAPERRVDVSGWSSSNAAVPMMSTRSERQTGLISVVIPHLNQAEDLARCLASLSAQVRLSCQVEIIVVDNGSKTMPHAVCDRSPGCVLLMEPEPGPGPARNAGVARAKGAILAFIDADCVAHEEWLASIEEAFRSPDAMILGGDVRILCRDPARPTLIEAYESVFAYRMREYIEKKGFTGTGNLAMRADVFVDVGPFKGIGVAEDLDWGRRAVEKGYRILYRDDMIVYHPARSNFLELTKKWDRHIAHDFQKIRGKRHWRLRWIALGTAVGLSPPAEIPRILRSTRLNGTRARLLAILGLTRIRLYRAARMFALATGVDATRLSGSWNRT